MEEPLKQRLVGAVVLVSLAVVFVPILFDMPRETDGETAADLISAIPERPQVELGPAAGGTLEAPQTPRLDMELEREHGRNAPRADAGQRTAHSEASAEASAEAPAAGVPSSSPGASGAAQSAGASGEPASGTPSGPSVTRADPAPAKKRRTAGPVAETAAAGGWTVQIGSFIRPENALALRKRLRAAGYPAFIESGSSARGAVSRVFVGPMPDREQAKTSAAKLRREMALEGIVVPYPGG